MTHATCMLTAKNRDHLRNPTLGNRVWAIFTFVCTTQRHVAWPTSVCRRRLYGRSSPVSLCSLRCPPGALDADVYWPAPEHATDYPRLFDRQNYRQLKTYIAQLFRLLVTFSPFMYQCFELFIFTVRKSCSEQKNAWSHPICLNTV